MAKWSSTLREDAHVIWQAAVDAVNPARLLRAAFDDPVLGLTAAARAASRILVVGAGKAGAAMAASLEAILCPYLGHIEGLVNVPAESAVPLKAIRLHAARPAGTNQPTADGVEGSRRILELATSAGPEDLCICLLSGGGSALLPAPVNEITLADKQQLTQALHACGATINEMNTVRKHLSCAKGGQLARVFKGRALYSLIISDVVGDPLDVIASGPTAADPTTFADALAVLQKYDLLEQVAPRIREYLQLGAAGKRPETLKMLPDTVHNLVIGNNSLALSAAQSRAESLGYRVLNLGAFVEGETREVALVLAGILRSIRADRHPLAPPVCLLSGGETTVTLSETHGLGGRNQEFVLAAATKLGVSGLRDAVLLSGGTDGEDGPTDAAGAVADAETLRKAALMGILPGPYLARHDAYHFFEATGDLLNTGLTHTNVMDVRVMLIR